MPPLDAAGGQVNDWITVPAAPAAAKAGPAADVNDWITVPHPTAPPTSAGSVDEFGRSQSADLAPDRSGAVGRVVEAGIQGAKEGFGDPIGQTILTPEAQESLDAKQREGGVGGFLANLGSTAAKDVGTAGGVIAGGLNAAFRGVQGAVAQTGAELGAPELGRDIAAMPEAFMGQPYGLGRPKAPRLTPAAIADAVIAAPTVGDAIKVATQAASGAAEVSPQLRLLQQTEAGIMRRTGGEAGMLTDAERTRLENLRGKMADMQPAAPVEEMPTVTVTAPRPPAEPEAAGAAASRQGTPDNAFGRTAREIKGQSADMELADLMRTPKPGDASEIIPGASQTRAEIELSPSVSRAAKGLRQEFREGFNEHEKANNEIYHQWIDDVVPPREQVGTMRDLREKNWQDTERTVFGSKPEGEPVSAAPIVQHIRDVFADPIERRNSYLKKAFEPILNELVDNTGAPAVLGAKELYGIRQEMGRKVKDMATNTDLAHVRDQFRGLMDAVDGTITSAAPEYRAMMDAYHEASGPINTAERLQDIKLKITNGSDRIITFGALDRYLKSLWLERHGPNPYAPAKSIPQDTWDHLMLLHQRLARSASDQELAKTRGSDTTQLMMDMMRKGAIGGAHAIVGGLTHGLGNVAIPFVTKQIREGLGERQVRRELNPDLSRYQTPGP